MTDLTRLQNAVIGTARAFVRNPTDTEARQRLAAAVESLDRYEEERVADAVDSLLQRVGHAQGCDYTDRATAEEMAVHAALFLDNGGPTPACGPVTWWPHGELPPDLPEAPGWNGAGAAVEAQRG